jgi:hypothetical protein
MQPPVREADQVIPIAAPSDSGYGTASHCTRKIAQLAALHSAAPADVVSSPYNSVRTDQQLDNHSRLTVSDTSDTATVYSDAMSLSDSKTDSYVSGLAEDLFKRFDPKVSNAQIIETLSTALPGLLKALALKFGYEAPSQMHRDAMFFIHKHRM